MWQWRIVGLVQHAYWLPLNVIKTQESKNIMHNRIPSLFQINVFIILHFIYNRYHMYISVITINDHIYWPVLFDSHFGIFR